MPDEPITMVVEDSFALAGGLLISPDLDPKRFRPGTPLDVELIDPDGNARRVNGHFEMQHRRLLDGSSQWAGVIVLDADATTVKPGTKLTARPSG